MIKLSTNISRLGQATQKEERGLNTSVYTLFANIMARKTY